VSSRVNFAESDGGTLLEFRCRPINASEVEVKTFEECLSVLEQAWSRMFDELEDQLSRVS